VFDFRAGHPDSHRGSMRMNSASSSPLELADLPRERGDGEEAVRTAFTKKHFFL
jgi:hypothetical protein